MMKTAACAFMVIDHIGMILFPENETLRDLGRISFPLFAYQTAVSADKTHDPVKFLQRLLIWGSVSQIPYMLAKNYIDLNTGELIKTGLNIMFTFAFSMIIIISYKKLQFLWFCIFSAFTLISAHFLKTDYGIYGIFTVLIFYFSRSSGWSFALFGILNLFFARFVFQDYSQLYSISAFPLILIEWPRFKINRYFFYAFYPAHLIILFTASRLISS